ncbi:MAG: branched-chain amino acid transaminase [Chloroflexota bacterium]
MSTNKATKPEYAFFDGKIVPIGEAKVSVITQTLHYGTGVFGGMRAYWNSDEHQLFIYRAADHFERFRQSAGIMRINVPYSERELTDILIELIRVEDYHEDVYIRPLAYKAGETIAVGLTDIADGLTIFVQPTQGYVKDVKGYHVGFSAWRRVEDNAIPARGKVIGAYANSALIKTDASLAGYDDALVLNEDGHVAEASSANVFIVRKGVAITPSITSNTLEGIVRRSLIELLRTELGVEVVERPIDRTECYLAEEIFLCGTGAQVTPVTKIDHRTVGTGEMGAITHQLRELFFKVVTGNAPRYRDWLTPVYVPERIGK